MYDRTQKVCKLQGEHAAYSKICPKWQQEKEIQRIKVLENISYSEAKETGEEKSSKSFLQNLTSTLLNDGSNTYFHSPTQSFSAIDLSICSPSLLLNLTWSVLDNPLGSDHFPVVISYATPIACASIRQPRWKFDQADWETFRTQADITEDMVSSGSIDEAVCLVTSCILSAARNAIPQPSSRLPRFPKPWWNEECQMAKKDQNKA
ncbi:putative tick transposon [Trichonephila clavipes]|nr:putative tick transposon [Trichonephila clavipes]